MTVKASFYRAIKRSDVAGALTRYGEARAMSMVDKHMTSALITICSQNGKHGLVQRLWKAHSTGNAATPLNEYLCCDFIKGFTNLGDHSGSTHVLETAHAMKLVNTEVYNSYLSSCAKLQRGKDAIQSLEIVLRRMQVDQVEVDAYTCAIGVRVYADAGDLTAAQQYIDRLQVTPDVVVTNTLLRAAARLDNAQLALSILQRMEDEGPEPDIVSYNTTLHAVSPSHIFFEVHLSSDCCCHHNAVQVANASRESLAANPFDKVAAALTIRRSMRRRGLTEDAVTLSCLIRVFAGGDAMLTEALLDKLRQVEPRGGGDAAVGEGVEQLDLRGLTSEVMPSGLN